MVNFQQIFIKINPYRFHPQSEPVFPGKRSHIFGFFLWKSLFLQGTPHTVWRQSAAAPLLRYPLNRRGEPQAHNRIFKSFSPSLSCTLNSKIIASSAASLGSNITSYRPKPLSRLDVSTYRPFKSTISPSTNPW